MNAVTTAENKPAFHDVIECGERDSGACATYEYEQVVQLVFPGGYCRVVVLCEVVEKRLPRACRV